MADWSSYADAEVYAKTLVATNAYYAHVCQHTTSGKIAVRSYVLASGVATLGDHRWVEDDVAH